MDNLMRHFGSTAGPEPVKAGSKKCPYGSDVARALLDQLGLPAVNVTKVQLTFEAGKSPSLEVTRVLVTEDDDGLLRVAQVLQGYSICPADAQQKRLGR